MSDVRYWIAEPGATPEGPYDLDTLRGMRDRGRIGANTQVCPDGGMSWQPASNVLGSVANRPADRAGSTASTVVGEPRSVTAAPSESTYNAGSFDQRAGAVQPVSMVLPVIATAGGALSMGCCLLSVCSAPLSFGALVLGIIALVRAGSANAALERGDHAAFIRAAAPVSTLAIVALVLVGVAAVVAVFTLTIAAGMGVIP